MPRYNVKTKGLLYASSPTPCRGLIELQYPFNPVITAIDLELLTKIYIVVLLANDWI